MWAVKTISICLDGEVWILLTMISHYLVHSTWESMPVFNVKILNPTVMKRSLINPKKINNYKSLLLFCTLFIGSGCNPDLVDEPPMGRTEDTYFRNATEFRTKLVSVYASLYDHYHFAAPSFNFNGWITGTYLLPGDDLTENLAART